MLNVIHGDNIVASRNYLNSLIEQLKNKGVKEIIRLDGKKVSLTQIIQALESQSLFGTDKAIVIENLLSRQKGKTKEEILNYLSQADIKLTCILWEPKSIHANALKKFKNSQIKLFKTSATVFKFLDSLKPKNTSSMIQLMDQSIASDSVEMVFYMLARQVRLLLLATGKNGLKMAPWQLGKLKKQAAIFRLPKLLKLHHKLLIIDEKTKTGQSPLGLEGELDLLITSL